MRKEKKDHQSGCHSQTLNDTSDLSLKMQNQRDSLLKTRWPTERTLKVTSELMEILLDIQLLLIQNGTHFTRENA